MVQAAVGILERNLSSDSVSPSLSVSLLRVLLFFLVIQRLSLHSRTGPLGGRCSDPHHPTRLERKAISRRRIPMGGLTLKQAQAESCKREQTSGWQMNIFTKSGGQITDHLCATQSLVKGNTWVVLKSHEVRFPCLGHRKQWGGIWEAAATCVCGDADALEQHGGAPAAILAEPTGIRVCVIGLCERASHRMTTGFLV